MIFQSTKSRLILTWLGILVLTLWFGSYFAGLRYGDGESYEVRLAGGALFMQVGIPVHEYHSFVKWGDYSKGVCLYTIASLDDLEFPIWPGKWSIDGVDFLLLPLWCLCLLIIALNIYYWIRREHHYPPDHCQSCGYDLTSNVSGRCPECGTLIENDIAVNVN